MQSQLVSSHGMLAILEVLEGRCSRDVIMKLLQIINLVRPVGLINLRWKLIPFDVAGNGGRWLPGEFLLDWWDSSHDG